VDPELAGEEVVVWWGLFDQELYVEFGEERFGPYAPVGGPVPLHRYREHRKSRRESRADKVTDLAARISIPKTAVSREADLLDLGDRIQPPTPPSRPFDGPDPFHELTFPTALAARRIDDLEPQLTRHGYDVRSLCDQFDAKPIEIRQLMRGDLNPQRSSELIEEMRAAGLPL
jgi:hypothetical protein